MMNVENTMSTKGSRRERPRVLFIPFLHRCSERTDQEDFQGSGSRGPVETGWGGLMECGLDRGRGFPVGVGYKPPGCTFLSGEVFCAWTVSGESTDQENMGAGCPGVKPARLFSGVGWLVTSLLQGRLLVFLRCRLPSLSLSPSPVPHRALREQLRGSCEGPGQRGGISPSSPAAKLFQGSQLPFQILN